MRLIKEFIHKDLASLEGAVFHRRAARAIILRGSDILLLYTKRYNDYSFPGGGLEADEDLIAGLEREIAEETGASGITILQEFGMTEEYRPYHKSEYDLVHMLSYYYVCKADEQLGEAQMEDYEVANGMSAVWIPVHEAIRHNRLVMNNQEASMGLSIERETCVLELVAEELLPANTL
ncbi:DNA mismatch repair protein MutT [Paenibacillus sambharensis]|uniref:DNA mismatch repair protein MutT n=1 Tax=Paenibacillus sambharensis TaxID=1803190 RepID=A0A2W1L663_9BACL|nr:NUDIX domain-containing protein [Paenibacillus sambharensis]PZD95658.1 DNA mismatch repair protein MutT [Paenibacillus sambharensis]